MKYNWQQPDWPGFTYSLQEIEDTLIELAAEIGHVSGMLKTLPEENRIEAIINTMVAEAIKTSEIEGEYLSRQDIVSTIRNNLGLNEIEEPVKDKKSQGAGELMVEVHNSYVEPLTKTKLFAWHKMLLSESRGINVGVWRKHEDPMQVISGAVGKEKIHFEAPPSSRVPDEMKKFIEWFNVTAPGGKNEMKKAPVRSAIAHLYFESIHPFEDGNGRIGRAIAEKALAQTIGQLVLLSLSRTIETKKKLYYNELEQAQQSNDITSWVKYFVNTILKAQIQSKEIIDFILKKSKFFDRFKSVLNERQEKVIRKMLDAGPEGFKGGMSAKKYISIARTSKATATRDLQNLLEMDVLQITGAGRSTNYILNI
ncbi:MAG: Fic family protein [Chitinophagaceae bacterium]